MAMVSAGVFDPIFMINQLFVGEGLVFVDWIGFVDVSKTYPLCRVKSTLTGYLFSISAQSPGFSRVSFCHSRGDTRWGDHSMERSDERLWRMGWLSDERSEFGDTGRVVGAYAEHLRDVDSRLTRTKHLLRERRQPREGNEHHSREPDDGQVGIGLPKAIQ